MREAVKKSILIHSVLLFLMIAPRLFGGAGDGEEGGKKGAGGAPEEVTVTIIPKSDGGGDAKKCKKWYGGVGIVSKMILGDDSFTEEVQYVAEGYPADRVGLRPGDFIVDGAGRLRGDPGTSVTFTYSRNGVRNTVTVRREKICTDQ